MVASDRTSAGAAEAADPTPNTCDWRTVPVHVHAARQAAQRAFAPRAGSHLRRAAGWREHKFCLARKQDRDRIARIVNQEQAELRAWEKRNALRLKIRAVTPYVCGFGRSAIPCSIVYCESGGSWSAYNPSGAVAIYQLLGKGAPFPVTSLHDKYVHHLIAYNLYAGGAGRSHWVC